MKAGNTSVSPILAVAIALSILAPSCGRGSEDISGPDPSQATTSEIRSNPDLSPATRIEIQARALSAACLSVSCDAKPVYAYLDAGPDLISSQDRGQVAVCEAAEHRGGTERPVEPLGAVQSGKGDGLGHLDLHAGRARSSCFNESRAGGCVWNRCRVSLRPRTPGCDWTSWHLCRGNSP